MFTAANVYTLQDMATIPVTTVWGAVEEKYRSGTNPFREAGVVSVDPLLMARAAGEGIHTTIQQPNALAYRESNISNSDPTQIAVPLKGSTRTLNAVRRHSNISFSEMDMVRDLMGRDPLGNLAERVGAYYMPQDETAEMFAILDGLVAADKANGSQITLTDTTNSFSLNTVIAGTQLLGDAKQSIKALGMSSATHALIQSQQINGFVPAAQTNLDFDQFGGKRIIVDDRFADKTVGTGASAKNVNRVYGLGDELFQTGVASASVPFEVFRSPEAGQGGGQWTAYFRWQSIVHPRGYSFTGTVASEGGPAFAELSAAGAWTRVSEKKLIPLVVMETVIKTS